MGILKNIYLHIKYVRILRKVYKQENLISNLSKLFNCNVHEDWLGRLYMVLNPNLIPREEQILEYSENGLSNETFIEKWVMDRLIAAEKFIKANNLFDILSYKIKKIDDYDNYLFVFEPITFEDFKSSIKKVGILLTILIILSIIGGIII